MINYMYLAGFVCFSLCLCLFTIPEKIFKTIKWLVVLIVIGTTLFILNGGSPPEWLTLITKLLQSLNIFDPTGWENISPIYRDCIASVYYLFVSGLIILFFLNLSYQDIILKQVKEMPVWKNILGVLLSLSIFYLFLIAINNDGHPPLTIQDLQSSRVTSYLFNSMAGLVIFEYIFLMFVGILVSYVQWLVWLVQCEINNIKKD